MPENFFIPNLFILDLEKVLQDVILFALRLGPVPASGELSR